MLCRNPIDDDDVGGDEDYQRAPPVNVGRMHDAARNPSAANNVRGTQYRVTKNQPLLYVLLMLYVRMSGCREMMEDLSVGLFALSHTAH